MRLGRLSRAVALVAVAATLVGAAAACRPTSSLYAVPDELPPNPGDVVRTTPVLFANRDNGIRATAFMYRSTDTHGEPNAVTGTLYVPRAAWEGGGPRPVVGFAPGTQGVADRCAPSRTLANGSNYEVTVIRRLLDQGWAVAVTDYEGLGTPGTHTYFNRDAEAHALLDAVRAAQRIPNSGVSADAPVGLWGFSQGGQAAGGAAEIEATYAPELDVVGTVAAGVPADGLAVWQNLDAEGPGNDFFFFVFATVVGLDAAYPELDIESRFTDAGRDLYEQAFEGRGLCLFDGLEAGAGLHLADLMTITPEHAPAWVTRVSQQNLGTRAPTAPLLLFQGSNEQVMPADMAHRLRDAWCGLGVQLTYVERPVDHLTGDFAVPNDGIPFLTARFAGEPAATTCGT